MVKVNWLLDDPEDAFSQNDLVREWESFRSANPSFPVNAGGQVRSDRDGLFTLDNMNKETFNSTGEFRNLKQKLP